QQGPRVGGLAGRVATEHDANADTDADSDSDSDIDTDPWPHTDADTWAHAHADADADSDACAHAHADADSAPGSGRAAPRSRLRHRGGEPRLRPDHRLGRGAIPELPGGRRRLRDRLSRPGPPKLAELPGADRRRHVRDHDGLPARGSRLLLRGSEPGGSARG